jgi:hypothetical protein
MKINIGTYPEGNEERVVGIRIDKYDSWSADHTLAMIILPVLKQLKETKHGSPHVDDEDVPEHLVIRASQAAPKENDWDTDEHWHKRWDYVLDCMIWSFNEIVQGGWEDQYYTYDYEYGANSEYADWMKHMHIDQEGLDQHTALVQQGLNLFGKYYLNLWS